MELYTQTEAARVAVERERRVAGQHANGHRHDHGGNGHAESARHDAAPREQGKGKPRPEAAPAA